MAETKLTSDEVKAKIDYLVNHRSSISEQSANELVEALSKIPATQKVLIEALARKIANIDTDFWRMRKTRIQYK